jgi:YebC/PmpR family DNA-binding regulatory protein
MAGHSKFKNIQHRKGAQDKKKARIFTKLVREIVTAAKIGSADPHHNARLRNAIEAARIYNLPKERIDKALLSAHDSINNENYVEICYEGFAAGGIAIMVEALTDNKNRTAADVRAAFTKFNGNLGETGSVNFMFDHVGIIQYAHNISSIDNILEVAIEHGAIDIESDDCNHIIYTEIRHFLSCQASLFKIYGICEEAYIGWKPHEIITIQDKDQAEMLLRLVDQLEDSDDVQRLFGNYELSDDLYTKLMT